MKFRQSKCKTHNYTLRLTPEEKTKLEQMSKKQKKNISDILRSVIK